MLQQDPVSHRPQRVAGFSDESLISGRQLRQLLGNCSGMHIWRLLNKQELQPLGFPIPIKINGRNYWRLGEIRQWIRDQEAKSRKQAALTSPDAETRPRPHGRPLGISPPLGNLAACALCTATSHRPARGPSAPSLPGSRPHLRAPGLSSCVCVP